jgi:hypothetical protein
VVTTSIVKLPPAASTLPAEVFNVRPHLLREGLGELSDEDEQAGKRTAVTRIP